ncbi:BON domain-containing protein [Chromobacterium haemolyticum]|uniref:BON domain-containing protein n=1 Tax=Chromobacterium haemolyticum TaxID=394935 RepID=UPI0019663083|nr:BON domain-containing protein [Chromobacterium haemolyticum]
MIKTDSQLQADVMAELMWDPAINSTHIGVQVNDGVVTLCGHVANYAQKWSAERAALRVGGVTAIAEGITVELPGQENPNDSDISRTAARVLQMMGYLKENSIKVMVEHGWVTLSGEVEWDYQRKDACKLVCHLSGVTGISSDIGIRPKTISRAVKEEVEAALKRRAIRDIASITVSIDGSDVILGGTVHSWSERALAQHAAAGMPGVRNVIDKIKVTI